ncbi:hypothetical protein ThvES_00017700 [Thiovulum sp. ES]|nr:hypothetical protein ThvES_00017700 [Thiovulum sp. ES]
MTTTDLETIYKKALSNNKTSSFVTYLTSRGFSIDDVSELGYIDYMEYEDYEFVNVSVLPIRDLQGNLQMLEFRNISHKTYLKLQTSSFFIPCYNCKELLNYSTIIITESYFNAKVLQKKVTDKLVISTLKASVSNHLLHMLAINASTIILAFDNDSSGIANTKRVLSFYEKYYPDIDTEVIDFIGDIDLNDIYLKDMQQFSSILYQLKYL